MELERYTDSQGHKRKGIRIKCQQCQKEIFTRTTNISKFCSRTCSSKFKSLAKTTEVECAQCKTKFRKKHSHLPNSKSRLYFCSRKCKDQAQRLGGIKEIMPPHYGTADPTKFYRNNFTTNDLVCKRCGYQEFKVSVQIHHIDHNHKNNDISNLMPLCANCHWGLHNNCWTIADILSASPTTTTESNTSC